MESKEPTRLASAEPPARMISPDTYTSGSQNNSIVTPPQDEVVQHARIPFSSVVTSVSKPSEFSAPPYHGGSAPNLMPHGMSLSEPLKKKRGRPRKYGPDGTMALALCPFSSVPSYSTPLFKRNRGRPRGSGKRQQLNALGSSGIGFTPHVITVKAGEDVASKIMSFSQQGPRAICIISANGAISNVTLRQPAISGGTVTYEGRFEIISLSGSFLLTETGGTRSRTGGLSVSLAGPDGRVLGGGVAGLLIAATPVQLVVGSFISEGKKPRPRPPPPDLREPSSAVPHMSNLAADAAASPQSRGTMSESSGGPNSPPNQSINTGQLHGGMPSYPHTSWPSSQAMADDIQH